MYNKLTVEDIDVKGKKVLVRCDFNVPLDENCNITDENRIVGALPTIEYLIKNGAKVILCSHMGKPKGEPKPELSLAPVAKRLSEKLGKEVVFAADDNVVGENAKKAVAEMIRYSTQSTLLKCWHNKVYSTGCGRLSYRKGNKIPRQCRKFTCKTACCYFRRFKGFFKDFRYRKSS